jgi:hypothetical protein
MTSSTDEEFVATHLLGEQDRVPRLGHGAMQLAGPREWAAVFKYGVEIQPGSGVTLC